VVLSSIVPVIKSAEIQDNGLQTGSTNVSACRRDRSTLLRVQQFNGTMSHCTGRKGSPEIQNGSLQTGSTYISACRQDRNAMSTAKPMFSGSSNPAELLRIIFHRTGSGKFKMAAIILEVLISPLLDKIGTRFQRLNLCFWGPAMQQNY